MNWKALTLSLLLALALKAQANYTAVFDTGNATIPDNDGNGYQNSQVVSGLVGPIAAVEVTITLRNGFNGDLYAWLSHGNGLAVLLNRVGVSAANAVGYGNAGFGLDAQQNCFTLDDQAGQDVHFYQSGAYSLNSNGQLTGSWQPDGRVIDPGSSGASFDAAPRSNRLSVFDGLDANGPWTLFVADLAPGGISTLADWGLRITAIPEPGTGTLVLCGLAGGALWAFVPRRIVARRNGSDRRSAEPDSDNPVNAVKD